MLKPKLPSTTDSDITLNADGTVKLDAANSGIYFYDNGTLQAAMDTGDIDYIDADLDSLVKDMMAGKDSTKIYSILDSLGRAGSP